MRTIAAAEFKAKCLALLDEVAETKEELVVTKRGKPVAKIVPTEAPRSLIGTVKYNITDDELVYYSAWEGYEESDEEF